MTKGNDAGSPVRLRTLREIERVALLHMDPVITEFLQGGSGAELTLERNRSDFDRIRFVPRVMSGCPYPSTSTTVAGIDLLRQEIETVLVLLGRGGITDLDRSAVELES